MSYTKITTSFKDHETVLTAAHLQHMEDGISANDTALGNRVRTDTNAQGLTATQKSNARANIDAPSTAELTSAVAAEAALRTAADDALDDKTDDLQEELDEAKDNITDLTALSGSMIKTRTVTGNPLTLHNALAGKAQKLTIQLNPKQNLNGYDRPWAGGTGKNKAAFDQYDSTLSDVHVVYSGGTVTLSGTASSLRDFNTSFSFNNSGKTLDLGSGTYVFSIDKYENVNDGGNILYLTIKNTDTNALRYVGVGSTLVKTETVAANEVISSMFIRVASGTTLNNVIIKPFLALASESDGTWEPYSNICPITGYDRLIVTRTGKNLMTCSIEQGTISDKTGQTGDSKNHVRSSDYIPVPVDTDLYFKRSVYSNYMNLRCYDSNKNYLGTGAYSGVTIIDGGPGAQPMPANRSWCILRLSYPIAYIRFQDSSNNLSTQYQIEVGNTVSEYEQGDGESVNISTGEAGTVYGGTVTINQDGSGTLLVDHGLYTVTGDEVIAYSATTKTYYFNNVVTNINGSWNNYTSAFEGLCSMFAPAPATTGTADWNTMTGNYIGYSTNGFRFRVQNYVEDDVAAFAELVTGCVIAYKLATPVSIPLTAQQISMLLGENYIWTNGDTLELTYRTDKYGDVEKLLSAFPVRSIGPADVVAIDDGADGIPVKALSVAIEPVQNLNGYDHPWIGGAGKNLYAVKIGRDSFANNVNATHTSNADELTIVMADDTSSGVYANVSSTIRQLIGTLNGDYTISLDIKANEARNDILVGVQSVRTTAIAVTTSWTRVSFTATFSGTASPLVIYNNHGGTGTGCTLTVRNLMVEAGSTASDYEPYSNISPITGHTEVSLTQHGKNLLENTATTTTINGVTFAVQSDGTIIANGTATSNANLYVNGDSIKNFGGYKLSGCPSGGSNTSYFLEYYDATASSTTRVTGDTDAVIPATTNGHVCRVVASIRSGYTANNVVFKPMIRLAAFSDATYEPYTKETIAVTLPSSAGAVYGGTLNLTTGTLTVDRVKVNASELTWVTSSVANTFIASNGFPVSPETHPASDTFVGETSYGYTKTYYNHIYNGSGDREISWRSPGTTSQKGIAIKDSGLASHYSSFNLAAFQAAVADLDIVYEIAPITYTLNTTEITTLLGNNVIWSDAGDVKVEYRADSGLLIEKIMAAMTAYGLTL